MFSFLAELETMEEFEPPKLWKRHGVLLAIRAHRTSKEISEFFNISLRMVQTVGRELEDSGFDYEATAKRKRHDMPGGLTPSERQNSSHDHGLRCRQQ